MTISYVKFGWQTECIMGNSKIVNTGCMRDYVNPGLLSELIVGIPNKLS